MSSNLERNAALLTHPLFQQCLDDHAKKDAEIERLTQWVHDLQADKYINCVYCGYRYGPDSEVASTMQEALYEHISHCPKHPLLAAKQEIERLTTERDEAREAAREIYGDGTSVLAFAERWTWLEESSDE